MLSILIIEDDPSYSVVMETILQMEGFDVQIAPDGRSGLALLRKKRPDLILCDIMLPDMDGHLILETLKKERTFSDIPFIFVTALGERADVRLGMTNGADDYLPKPFSADELLAAITGRIHRYELLLQQRDKAAFQKEQDIIQTKITRREREILLLVGQGITSREIAERLKVALKTVEVHRANLMKKLGAANAVRLARWAVIAEQLEPSG